MARRLAAPIATPTMSGVVKPEDEDEDEPEDVSPDGALVVSALDPDTLDLTAQRYSL